MSDIRRQSGIRYLKTERDIARELAMESRIPPIRFFDLEGLGIDRGRFLRDLAPSFERLSWDPYDVKRVQLDFLSATQIVDRKRLADFGRRYLADNRGDVTLRELRDVFVILPEESLREFERIRSYRRRSIAEFQVVKVDSAGPREPEWRICQTVSHGFAQAVDADDPRFMKRIFDPAADSVLQHPLFTRLILAVAEMVEDAEIDCHRSVTGMSLTFHQMGQVTHDGEPSEMAPEGIHRDGADYIVSALVLERDDVVGGRSRIILGKSERTLLDIELQAGQGLFQADSHLDLRDEEQLWHGVSPVYLRDTDDDGRGERNIFGFDVVLHRTSK